MESSAAKTSSKKEKCKQTDSELVTRANGGQLKAFEELMSKYERKVYNIAYRMTGNREDAEEILQETFLSVYKSLPRFKSKSAFSTWLYRIAVNAALMKLRKKKVETLSLDEPLTSDDSGGMKREVVDWTTPENIVERKRLMEIISKEVDSLPDTYGAIVLLKDGEGLQISEIARILKMSVPAVKSKLHRARMHLRRRLSDYFSPTKKAVKITNV